MHIRGTLACSLFENTHPHHTGTELPRRGKMVYVALT